MTTSLAARTYHGRDVLIATCLLLLALIPSAAGAFRVGEIASGAPTTADNARFMEVPLPVVLHIIAALVYSGIGAFQFLRRCDPATSDGTVSRAGTCSCLREQRSR